MPKMNLNTPNRIAFQLCFIVFVLSFALIITYGLFFSFSLLSLPFFYIIISIYFILLFFIFKIIINQFIYEKLKVIYKNIYKYKRSSAVIETNLDKVDSEVMKWAKGRIVEINKEKTSEKFRRNFLGNVSHELKTPIFNIQGYVQTLIDGAIHDNEVNTRYLERANKSVDRMITIVEDLETITRLESEEITIQFEKIDIKNIVQDVFEQLELKTKKRGIKLIELEYPGNTLVQCDKEKIFQVLLNILSNSIKYGKENGKTEIRYYDMGENILIEIADDGIGIQKKHLNRLFERFYRVDKDRSRKMGGSGLGLAIVKHIIEAHKQTINVRSTFQEGSTFSFTLKKYL